MPKPFVLPLQFFWALYNWRTLGAPVAANSEKKACGFLMSDGDDDDDGGDGDDDDEDEEEGEEGGGGEGWEKKKSNNPNLTGGEKSMWFPYVRWR